MLWLGYKPHQSDYLGAYLPRQWRQKKQGVSLHWVSEAEEASICLSFIAPAQSSVEHTMS